MSELMSNHAPIFVAGSWHSGTRMIVEILEKLGVDSGLSRGLCSKSSRDLVNSELTSFFVDRVLELPQRVTCTAKEKQFLDQAIAKLFPEERRFCIKTPNFSYLVPYLLSAFPDAMVIGIIRDGRDVSMSDLGVAAPSQPPRYREFGLRGLFRFYVLSWFLNDARGNVHGSMRNWRRWQKFKMRCYFDSYEVKSLEGIYFDDIPIQLAKNPPKEAVFGAKLWSTANEVMIRSRGLAGYYEIRYEDIVLDPVGEIQKLSTFLGIPLREDYSDFSGFIRQERINKFAATHNNTREFIMNVAEGTLRKLGYL